MSISATVQWGPQRGPSRATTSHVQCKIQCGTTHSTSWLPQRYAEVGGFVKLRDDDGVMERERDYLYQRVASDI